LAKINGRYPEVGQAMNLKCDMVYYCLAGQGTVALAGRKKKIKPGQALLVGKNKKYYVIGKKLAVLIISNPIWDKRQYRIIKPTLAGSIVRAERGCGAPMLHPKNITGALGLHSPDCAALHQELCSQQSFFILFNSML